VVDAAVGTSPMTFLRRLRVRRMAELLRFTDEASVGRQLVG
jgi:transcriptional regulator GlxA family with amidase domain